MIGECFIATAHGPIAVADLQPGELLFSWDSRYKFIELQDIEKTSEVDLFKAIHDNGTVVHATKNHEFLLRGGSYKKLDNIDTMTSVMAFTRSIRGREWAVSLYDDSNTRMPEHLFVAEQMGISGEHIHHINGDHSDNRPGNLVGLTEVEHRKIHDQWKRDKIISINNDIKDKAIAVRADSWKQWYFTLPQEEKDAYWEKLRLAGMRSARQRVADGTHNFVANNPMLDPEKVILMKKGKVATTAYKLKDMGLSIEEDSWDESVRYSGLYKSHCFRSGYINDLFGDWDAFVQYLNDHNSKLINVEFDYIGPGFNLVVPNFVVCNQEMSKGICIKGSI